MGRVSSTYRTTGTGKKESEEWIQSILDAMGITQERAEADRQRALELVGGVPEKVYGSTEYSAWAENIKNLTGYTPITAAEVLSGPEYEKWSAQVDKVTGYKPPSAKEILSSSEYQMWKGGVEKLMAAPEAITPEIAGYMFEEGKIPIEAQTQQNIRDIQRGYYGGGAPGGAMLSAIEQQKAAKTGELGGLKRAIETERALRRHEDLLSAIGEAGELGRYAGGVTERAGAAELAALMAGTEATGQLGMYAGGVKERTAAQELASLMAKTGATGEMAQFYGGMEMGTAQSLADILSHTITEVPKYPESLKIKERPKIVGTKRVPAGAGYMTSPVYGF